jgi:hypothetical protein
MATGARAIEHDDCVTLPEACKHLNVQATRGNSRGCQLLTRSVCGASVHRRQRMTTPSRQHVPSPPSLRAWPAQLLSFTVTISDRSRGAQGERRAWRECLQ